MQIDIHPTVVALETGLPSDRTTEVAEVHMSSEGLFVQVSSQLWEARAQFKSFYGFRVLDELDLAEFWSQCTLTDGWLFEVVAGGWKDLELQRPNFISGQHEAVKEYLIIGLNECVSVLSEEPPLISKL